MKQTHIMDETEQTGIVIANERAYVVPLDVKQLLDGRDVRIAYLENMVREALDRLDLDTPERARNVLIEALSK